MSQPDNASLSDGFLPFDDVLVKNTVYNNQENERDDIENSREDGADLSEKKIRSLTRCKRVLCNSLEKGFYTDI